mgnify:FL=1
MHLEIRSTNIHFGDSVRDYVARRMESAIGQHAKRIGLTTVHFADINGPHGGKDKQCRIAARLRRGKTICVEDSDTDLIRVVDRAADRIKHTLAQEMERRRSRRRRAGSQKPTSD